MEKEIKLIIGNKNYGTRIGCNLSPSEMVARKKEVIANFLENVKIDIDIVVPGSSESGDAPQYIKSRSGYWAYCIELKISI